MICKSEIFTELFYGKIFLYSKGVPTPEPLLCARLHATLCDCAQPCCEVGSGILVPEVH